MKEEKCDYVDDDLEESRRRWEGIHNGEAAQYRMPFEDTSPREWVVTCCILPGLGVTAVLLAVAYGLYKLILILF